MTTGDERRPALEGVRVLDLTRFVAGPYCTSLLADHGAEVVKIEPLQGEQNRVLGPMIGATEHGVSSYFLRFAKNKKSVSLDLKHPQGLAVFKSLIQEADVLVENFRPGVLERMGLGWPELSELNKRLIYCTITGFGHEDSPMRDQGAFTPVVEAISGAMVYKSREAPPTIAGYPVGDIFPASLAAAGISMALYRRQLDGLGARIDMSMFDAMLSMNERAIGISAMSGRDILPGISADLGSAPSGVFAAKDGFVSISVVGEQVWQRFCVAIERKDWATDPLLADGPSRAAHEGDILAPAITAWLADKTRSEAVEHLVRFDVPVAPVHRPTELRNVDQVVARKMVIDYPDYEGVTPTVVADPIRFAGESRVPIGPAAEIGQHSFEILHDWCGLERAKVDELIRAGVLRESGAGTGTVNTQRIARANDEPRRVER